MKAVKSLKADWAIITLMIVVAVVMYGYLPQILVIDVIPALNRPIAQGGSSTLTITAYR